MNLRLLYQWQEMVSSHFSSFTVWQQKRLAIFSLGVVLCEHCHQSRIAKVLSREVWAVSIARRLRRCIQLAWTCYEAGSAEAYPIEGQVGMIATMLAQLKAVVPDDRQVIVMADRGIGNSPALCRAVEELGWHYLFRVPKTVKVKTDGGVLHPYQEVKRGGRWSASGSVFIKRGKLPAHVRVVWERSCAEPWILVTNNPELTGREYRMRNWQEQSFRDLKSGGWQMQACRLRLADRMERFLAILALAQGMALAFGSLALLTGQTRRLIKTKDGKIRRPISLFKEGIDYFNKQVLRNEKLPSMRPNPNQRLH